MDNANVEIYAILAEAESAFAALGGNATSSRTVPTDASDTEPPAPSANPPSQPRLDRNLHRVLGLEVPVIVRLAERSMPVKAVIQLATGSIIEFDKAAEDELDLMINNKCIGHGQAVKVGENFGLRITRIDGVKEKIQAMGQH